MPVHYEVADGVAQVELDSPANRNALSAALVRGLLDAFATSEEDPSVRVILVRHSGSTLCAGVDLQEQRREGGPAAGTERLVTLLRRVIELPKPVVVQIDGHVRAAGVGLVAACDIALAGPSADFALTESRLGLAPAVVSLTAFSRMTPRAAMHYALTGEVFDGEAAARCGLVTRSVENAADAVAAVVSDLKKASAQGLAETKLLLTQGMRADFAARATEMRELSQRLFESGEAQAAMAAFLDRS